MEGCEAAIPGGCEERTGKPKIRICLVNLCQGMGNWPLFPMISVSVFKVMVSTCQSNDVCSSVVLQKIQRNCLCDTFENSVLWIIAEHSSIYYNFSWSFFVHHCLHSQTKWYSSFLKLIVLVSTGLIIFLVADTVLCSGFRMRVMLATQQYLIVAEHRFKDISASCAVLTVRGWGSQGDGRWHSQNSWPPWPKPKG